MSAPRVHRADVGFVIPPIVVSYLQRRRQNMFNETALAECYSCFRTRSRPATPSTARLRQSHQIAAPVSTEFERVATEITLGTSVEDALSALLLRINSRTSSSS